MDPIKQLTGQVNADNYFAGYTSVPRLVESYRPRDAAQFQRTVEMISRGSIREAMVSDDLPILLAGSTDLYLRAAYETVAQPWRQCFTTSNFPNLRLQEIMELLELETDDQQGNPVPNNLIPEVPEGHEYDEARFGEDYEQACIATYGITFGLTRKMLINDDRNGLQRVPSLLGRSMARTINWHVYNVMTANASPTGAGLPMRDGVQLFDIATHKNMVSGDYDLTLENLAEQFLAFGTQVTKSGTPLNQLGITPRFLIVPAALALTADYLVSQASARLIVSGLTDVLTPDVNIMAGRLQVVVFPELTDNNDWYLAVDPSVLPTIEMGFLNGVQAPSLFTRNTDIQGNLQEADGVKYKIRHDFGAYAAMWVGLRKIRVTGGS